MQQPFTATQKQRQHSAILIICSLKIQWTSNLRSNAPTKLFCEIIYSR